jgi:hypothetical protein
MSSPTDSEREIRSWDLFPVPLKSNSERQLFKEMLESALPYFFASPSMFKVSGISETEKLLMSILLAQQKLILWLKSEVQKTKTELEQEEASEKSTDSPKPV